MLMKRDIYKSLVEWKIDKNRKPLILEGARQTGKTYILKEFGKKEFENFIYCNFEQDNELKSFFRNSLNPKKILESLSLYFNLPIRPGKDLIFFDEIQESNQALNALKYFNEEAQDLAVVAAGSLLGVKMSVPKSFPVGKVTLQTLHPMSFPEFLDATGNSRYRQMLENIDSLEPLPGPFHAELCALLRTYYFVGGMPEAVAEFTASGSYEKVRAIQSNISRAYSLDFAKHAPSSDIPKLSLIWDSIPLQLARENKKFVFSALAKGARGREYENAIQWLVDSGLVCKVTAVDRVEQPLAGFADRSSFKIYALDVGLLGAMAGIPPDILVRGDELFSTYHGAFVENYTAQQLIAAGRSDLHYWRSESRQAEVDFLIESDMQVLPLEVKAGLNPRSKSLQAYKDRYHPSLRIRSTLLNLMLNDDVLNVPLYAVGLLDKWIKLSKAQINPARRGR